MHEFHDPIADMAKQFALAGVLCTVGCVIFVMAAYKVYNPPAPPKPAPMPRPDDCGNNGGFGPIW